MVQAKKRDWVKGSGGGGGGVLCSAKNAERDVLRGKKNWHFGKKIPKSAKREETWKKVRTQLGKPKGGKEYGWYLKKV